MDSGEAKSNYMSSGILIDWVHSGKSEQGRRDEISYGPQLVYEFCHSQVEKPKRIYFSCYESAYGSGSWQFASVSIAIAWLYDGACDILLCASRQQIKVSRIHGLQPASFCFRTSPWNNYLRYSETHRNINHKP